MNITKKQIIEETERCFDTIRPKVYKWVKQQAHGDPKICKYNELTPKNQFAFQKVTEYFLKRKMK